MTENKYAAFPSEPGPIKDLPLEILADVQKSFKAYFKCDKLKDGWDVERGVKILLDSKTGNYIFCKLVAHNGQAKVAVLHLDKTMTDKWINNTAV